MCDKCTFYKNERVYLNKTDLTDQSKYLFVRVGGQEKSGKPCAQHYHQQESDGHDAVDLLRSSGKSRLAGSPDRCVPSTRETLGLYKAKLMM